jgi:hypothetical protein
MYCYLWKSGERDDIDGEEGQGTGKCRCERRLRCRNKELHRYVQKAYGEVDIPCDSNTTRFELHERLC